MNSNKYKIHVGIPTINRADLLQENLNDLEEKFLDLDELHIVDNGMQGENGKQGFVFPPKLADKIFLESMPENIGVAGSWNRMLKRAFEEKGADYLLILNDDIVLGRTRADIEEIIESRHEAWFLTGEYFWSVILISKDCYRTVGLFDETFFPAYYEDNDYARRILLNKEIEGRWGQDSRLTPEVKRNSMTIKKEPALNRKNHLNQKYYVKKWGGMPGKEKYTQPFNGNG